MSFGTSLMAGGKSINIGFQAVILIAFIGLMYFLLIRPQKKKEKEVKQMRNALSVGDEVVTIGGICGKIRPRRIPNGELLCSAILLI